MDNDINNIEDISDIPEDISSESIDIEDIEDISDVYANEVVNEVLGSGQLGESSPAPGSESTYDDTVLLESLDSINESILSYSESLDHANHRLDQSYDLIIAITLLLGAFIAISIFRKLFDWLA